MIGKKDDLKRAAKTTKLPPASLKYSRSDDEYLVQLNMILTEGDRHRIKGLGLELDVSMQRLGHRAWNAFLASHGLPGLTPVLTGSRGRAPAEK